MFLSNSLSRAYRPTNAQNGIKTINMVSFLPITRDRLAKIKQHTSSYPKDSNISSNKVGRRIDQHFKAKWHATTTFNRDVTTGWHLLSRAMSS